MNYEQAEAQLKALEAEIPAQKYPVLAAELHAFKVMLIAKGILTIDDWRHILEEAIKYQQREVADKTDTLTKSVG